MRFDPEDLRCGKPGKRNVCGVGRDLVHSDGFIQIHTFRRTPSVVPEDRGPDHFILFIQHHKSVHLSAETDAAELAVLQIGRQLFQTGDTFPIPVFRILL